MRLWSLHPKYLDPAGLVAVWREALLAKKVLLGNTIGYKNHPQLIRFKKMDDPVYFIDNYLSVIFEESVRRRYKFDQSKFADNKLISQIPVTSGQIDFEWQHLLTKLKDRNSVQFEEIKLTNKVEPHPLFIVVRGNVESWERIG